MKWYVSGDTHGNFTRFTNMDEYKTDEKIGVIVLGDCAVNWTLDPEYDSGLKRQLCKKFSNFEWYLLRGNHDARPEDAADMKRVWDPVVHEHVWHEEKYPNIHYFIDGCTYTINGYKVLTIGGAYSVDKYFRLERNGIWHANEQLSKDEQWAIRLATYGRQFDFVLTHTAPICWEPTDLFLSFVDQNRVDKSTELWLDEIRQCIRYKIWLFGHYHRDRLERPGVQLMYQSIEALDDIWNRWNNPEGPEWWFPKSPMYYAKDR